MKMMARMVTVHRHRDAVLARAALDALHTYGPPVALIAGNGHARSACSVLATIARAAPGVTTHAIGHVEGETEMSFGESRIVPPSARADPANP